MYLRPVFVETDLDRIAGLIEANPFGVLVTDAGGMDASHIPFVVERTATGEGERTATGFELTAHLARANPQVARLSGGRALVIFSGPHAYIAPGWYKTQPAVPTWDYAAVHVHGVLTPIEDEAGIRTMMRGAAIDDPAGFDVDAMDPKYRTAMFNGVSAFRLVPDRVEAQWKMSQNRSVADRLSVIEALRGQGNHAVADLIAGTLPEAVSA
jgi:transcriptional regulator